MESFRRQQCRWPVSFRSPRGGGADRRVAAAGIVPALDPLEDRPRELVGVWGFARGRGGGFRRHPGLPDGFGELREQPAQERRRTDQPAQRTHRALRRPPVLARVRLPDQRRRRRPVGWSGWRISPLSGSSGGISISLPSSSSSWAATLPTLRPNHPLKASPAGEHAAPAPPSARKHDLSPAGVSWPPQTGWTFDPAPSEAPGRSIRAATRGGEHTPAGVMGDGDAAGVVARGHGAAWRIASMRRVSSPPRGTGRRGRCRGAGRSGPRSSSRRRRTRPGLGAARGPGRAWRRGAGPAS